MRNFDEYLYNQLQASFDEYMASDEDEDYWQA